MYLSSQAVARGDTDALSVRLGAPIGSPQAQLDGFVSRALRVDAPQQHNLYATEWRALDAEVAAEGAPMLMLGSKCSVVGGDGKHLKPTVVDGDWAAVVAVVAQRACLVPLTALEVALSLAQPQAAAHEEVLCGATT